MLDIRKFSWDMSLFLSQEFDLLSIDENIQQGHQLCLINITQML